VQPRWSSGPASITLVRHGESIGNVADARAQDDHAEALDIDLRDADVPLSDNGRAQAEALAGWLRDAAPADRPTLVISSPYRRASETATLAVAGLDLGVDLDERLRERDLGRFDRLTGRGIRARFPDESERRSRIGKFYYQPPGGESWADVVLRVRSFLNDLAAAVSDGERVWLVTHQAVIMAHRYVLEGLSEEQVLEASRSERLPNASRTVFVPDDSGYRMQCFGDATPVEQADAEVTHEKGKDEEHVRDE
jgi:broad specificity phosphatase PhoE